MFRFNFTSRSRLIYEYFKVDVVVTFLFTLILTLDVKYISLLVVDLFKIVTHVFHICESKLVHPTTCSILVSAFTGKLKCKIIYVWLNEVN